MMVPRTTRIPGNDTIPPEAWDHTHPDHDWWTNGRGWCFDKDCPDHTYGLPAEPNTEERP